MSDAVAETLQKGPMQGRHLIGEITEALHKFLLDGWIFDAPPPRIEEDLSFVPKDREEVLYVYMYRVAQNTALLNTKRWRPARISTDDAVYYERAPVYLDLHYMLAVHSRFRSDAERLLGWVMLRLHEATHLVYRPRRYILPDGREVDSNGEPWSMDAQGENIVMEKVSLALVDDLTVGDSINFFTIHEAPYRPCLTYRARCALQGSLLAASGATVIRPQPFDPIPPEKSPEERATGPTGRMDTRPRKRHSGPGSGGKNLGPEGDNPDDSEE